MLLSVSMKIVLFLSLGALVFFFVSFVPSAEVHEICIRSSVQGVLHINGMDVSVSADPTPVMLSATWHDFVFSGDDTDTRGEVRIYDTAFPAFRNVSHENNPLEMNYCSIRR
ncbi:MAG: hypothetical protein JW384_03613 [Nitrosomonadaceae bacterium]|nr:hypothetical protein [Nitrosomonadaceae bacterium]